MCVGGSQVLPLHLDQDSRDFSFLKSNKVKDVPRGFYLLLLPLILLVLWHIILSRDVVV